MRTARTLLWCVCGAVDYEMVGFHGKPLCFCGSDLQTGSQFLHVPDKIRGLHLNGFSDGSNIGSTV